MKRNVHVVGVGMIPFTKPGASEPYHRDGRARRARRAATMPVSTTASCSRPMSAMSTATPPSGQAAVYGVGLTGIPVFNLNNNCSTGSSALFLARQAVESGMVECALALGFEQMQPGALKSAPTTTGRRRWTRFADAMIGLQGWDDNAPRAAQFFGGAGRDYIKQHGIRRDTFARISVKARQHAARNPLAVFRNTVTLDEVLASPMVFDPLTRLQCCPPTCGAAAAIVCSEEFARQHGLDTRVRIAAQAMTTDTPSTFDSERHAQASSATT